MTGKEYRAAVYPLYVTAGLHADPTPWEDLDAKRRAAWESLARLRELNDTIKAHAKRNRSRKHR